MAALNLAPDELKQLELMRNRFFQLTNSLESLQNTVLGAKPLPSAESLQASAYILQQTLNSLQQLLNENSDLFTRVAVHPSTNFPGRTQEHILLQLLRKKLEPEVEGWVEEGKEHARSAGLDASKLGGGVRAGGGGDRNGYDDDEEDDTYGYEQSGLDEPTDPFNELWADVRDSCYEGIKSYIQNEATDNYTAAERAMGIENVRTGLRRNLEEEEEDDDEEEEEEDEDDEEGDEGDEDDEEDKEDILEGAGGVDEEQEEEELHPEHLLWFMARGDLNLPPQIELEAKRAKAQDAKRAAPAR
ncbi:mediator of RNA polymerase II transcription subunit 8 [Diplogelasinospora grovesii]|uniref:Mediator of RNA polymerase II transcription subunit 8 n=1 Tax=Diplogelasinospora grovesii TaxID=303347 RepID=A0AAN6MZ86_9PEZI|nr:mediator of RNA polymerase II transcription subunit 8 [Diplogelasinospora grovesii]